jgi:hypothetical protein
MKHKSSKTSETIAGINQFFSISTDEEALTELNKNEQFKSIVSKLKGTGLSLELFSEELMKKLGDLLNINIDVPIILSDAWSKHEEFTKYCDATPGDMFLVPLAEHTVISTHNPSLKILISGKEVNEFKFNVELRLTLKGVELEIQDGRIMKATLGFCEGEGEVKYLGPPELPILQKEPQSIEFPASIGFGEGIPIGKSAEQVSELMDENNRTEDKKAAKEA